MARIRTIKPEFWSSEQIMDCSPMARLLFIGLWNFCDDGGNHSASARTIKAEVFPGDDISSSNVQRLLDELSSNGLITLYTASNKDFWHVNGWNHQKIDRPSYKYPEFSPELVKPIRRMIVEDSPPDVDVDVDVDVEMEEEGSRRTLDNSSPNQPDSEQNTKPENPPPPQPHLSNEKFSMFAEWEPSESFDSLARAAGLHLGDQTPVNSLLEFRSYWLTQPGRVRTQSEWEHAFIKSIKSEKLRDVK